MSSPPSSASRRHEGSHALYNYATRMLVITSWYTLQMSARRRHASPSFVASLYMLLDVTHQRRHGHIHHRHAKVTRRRLWRIRVRWGVECLPQARKMRRVWRRAPWLFYQCRPQRVRQPCHTSSIERRSRAGSECSNVTSRRRR